MLSDRYTLFLLERARPTDRPQATMWIQPQRLNHLHQSPWKNSTSATTQLPENLELFARDMQSGREPYINNIVLIHRPTTSAPMCPLFSDLASFHNLIVASAPQAEARSGPRRFSFWFAGNLLPNQTL